MGGQVVLPTLARRDRVRRGQHVPAHRAGLRAGPDPRRGDQRRDLLRLFCRDLMPRVVRRGGQEPGHARRVLQAGHVVPVQGQQVGGGDLIQLHHRVPAVQHHRRLHERHHPLSPPWGRLLQQARQTLGLVVRQEVRVAFVARWEMLGELNRPVLLVPRDRAVPALQLHHKEAHRGQQQDVHLGRTAVRVQESQVRPRPRDAIIREQVTERLQGRRLRRRRRLAETHPPLRRQRHTTPALCSGTSPTCGLARANHPVDESAIPSCHAGVTGPARNVGSYSLSENISVP